MAEKKAQIVIKKITVVAGGAHGGAWKVAFADFMTAMMAFFLVMWLLATSSEAEKKAVSDYFSTPSVIEYQFQNFGVELTLEKLFLDLINEPLKTLQGFITPADKTPNFMAMGMKKVVQAYMQEQVGAVASDITVTGDAVVFEIPDHLLFKKGTSYPAEQFVSVMERVKGTTTGLENADIEVLSVLYRDSVQGEDATLARKVAEERLDIVYQKVKDALENDSVTMHGKWTLKRDDRGGRAEQKSGGFVRFEIKQKKVTPDGKKPKPFVEGMFNQRDANNHELNSMVDQVAKPSGGKSRQ